MALVPDFEDSMILLLETKRYILFELSFCIFNKILKAIKRTTELDWASMYIRFLNGTFNSFEHPVRIQHSEDAD